MARRLEFFFDYSCPFAYLGSTQVEALARRMDAELVLRPMLLGGVFRANGTPQKLFEAQVAPKAAHNLADMKRWAALYGVPLEMPATHPMRTVEALRATLATGCDPKVIHGFYRAYWGRGEAISEPSVLRAVLAEAGYDAAKVDDVLARIGTAEVKDDLRKRTDEAIALGVFGVPVYRVDGGAIVWGQDRMPMVSGLSWDEILPPRTPPATGNASAAPHTLELYWDFSSPFAYLGYLQAEALARRAGATLVHRPMLLGALFKEVGQPMVPLSTWPAPKQAYYFEDMKRSAAAVGATFNFPTRFPVNSVKALRTYLALPEARRDAFARATFKAYWADDRDISDDAVLRDLVGDGADEALARIQTPEIKQALIESTTRAVAAGVFGAPAWVIDGKDLFWGQDRAVLVERALAQ
jgi:2-hydroxychromene-2-carboxylate isomerase